MEVQVEWFRSEGSGVEQAYFNTDEHVSEGRRAFILHHRLADGHFVVKDDDSEIAIADDGGTGGRAAALRAVARLIRGRAGELEGVADDLMCLADDEEQESKVPSPATAEKLTRLRAEFDRLSQRERVEDVSSRQHELYCRIRELEAQAEEQAR
jgi:hypothetical protein